MTSENYQPRKVFTLEQATALLPLVRAITTDLVQLSREVIERRERLALLTAGRGDAKPRCERDARNHRMVREHGHKVERVQIRPQ